MKPETHSETQGKLYLVILCGAGDRSMAALGGKTPLEAARTPSLDHMAKAGRQGLLTVINDTICPESDSGAMALLSYDPLRYYTGRGPLEGLGTGFVKLGENAVSFRINFASYNAERQRLDRRTSRDLTDPELQALVAELREKITLEGCDRVRFEVMAFGRHRGILCFKSDATVLSGNVTNTDPGFIKVGVFGIPAADFEPVPQICKPLDDTPAAANTAHVINQFSKEASRILSESPINRARVAEGKMPANVILFRDGGDQPSALEHFDARFGRSLSFYGQIPAEKGLMALVGGRFTYRRLGEGEEEASYLGGFARDMLADPADVVFAHLKGADEPGHDGEPDRKVAAIELMDRSFFSVLRQGLRPQDICIVTSDHATPCDLKIHSADPVPALVCGPGVDADTTTRFHERAAAEGSLPPRRAVDLLPFLFGKTEVVS